MTSANHAYETCLRMGDFREGIRWMILDGPFALTAYVGIPEASPKAGLSEEVIPVQVHWGWTYSNRGDGRYRPLGWWWYGWDYGHTTDAAKYAPTRGHLWTANEVESQIREMLPAFEAWLREPSPVVNEVQPQ